MGKQNEQSRRPPNVWGPHIKHGFSIHNVKLSHIENQRFKTFALLFPNFFLETRHTADFAKILQNLGTISIRESHHFHNAEPGTSEKYGEPGQEGKID